MLLVIQVYTDKITSDNNR